MESLLLYLSSFCTLYYGRAIISEEIASDPVRSPLFPSFVGIHHYAVSDNIELLSVWDRY